MNNNISVRKIQISDNKYIYELQKLYLSNEARGLGVGKTLVEKYLSFAKRKQL